MPERPRLRLRGRRSECESFDRVVTEAKAGHSQVVVVRGEAGWGSRRFWSTSSNSASGCRIAASWVMNPRWSWRSLGLQQFCAPMLDRLGRLPEPRRDALSTTFGLSAGEPSRPFPCRLGCLEPASQTSPNNGHWSAYRMTPSSGGSRFGADARLRGPATLGGTDRTGVRRA